MEYRQLERTDVKVSKKDLSENHDLGEQNTEQEAHEQMDYALDMWASTFLIPLNVFRADKT